MTAAIPHALLLLHALVDILPYPKGPKGMWYEIRTGTTECIDEVELETKGAGADEFAGIGSVEAEAPTRKSRMNVSLLAHPWDMGWCRTDHSRLYVLIYISHPKHRLVCPSQRSRPRRTARGRARIGRVSGREEPSCLLVRQRRRRKGAPPKEG